MISKMIGISLVALLLALCQCAQGATAPHHGTIRSAPDRLQPSPALLSKLSSTSSLFDPVASSWQDAVARSACSGGNHLLLVITSESSAAPLHRRQEDEPAVSLVGGDASPQLPAAAAVAVALANRLLLAAEGALLSGRRLFPVRITFVNIREAAAAAAATNSSGKCSGYEATAPWVVFDAATGTLIVDAAALELLSRALEVSGQAASQQAAAAAYLVTAAVDALMGAVQQVGGF